MRRTQSLGRITSQLAVSKDKLRSSRVVHKIKGIPENKVGLLRRYWAAKSLSSYDCSDFERTERHHKKSMKDVLALPYNDKAMFSCLKNILSSSEHPYGMVVVEFGREILNTFECGDMARAFEDIKSRLESFSGSMADTLFLNYSDILGDLTSEDFSTLCQDALYDSLLSREPNVILDYYHTKFAERDQAICVLRERVASQLTPSIMDIQKKFCLTPKTGTMQPYAAAISTFQQISKKQSPLSKVGVLKETATSICCCIDQYWDVNRADFPKGEDPSISADDLVAIFSYVILKSQVGLVYSESEYIFDFVNEMNLRGETGYLITTFQCCCMSLASLEHTELLRTITGGAAVQ